MIKRSLLSDVGLPADHTIVRLDYHELTRTVIAHTGPPAHTPPPCGRLFFRSATASGYQPIEAYTAGTSVESIALDLHRPILYFLATVWHARSNGDWSMDGNTLYRFDLGERRCERLAGPNDMMVPAGCESVFLNQLISVSADGKSLFCRAGLTTPATFELKNGPVRGSRADYWVARLDLAGRYLAPISELTAFWA